MFFLDPSPEGIYPRFPILVLAHFDQFSFIKVLELAAEVVDHFDYSLSFVEFFLQSLLSCHFTFQILLPLLNFIINVGDFIAKFSPLLFLHIQIPGYSPLNS